ncbi:hypothetical protein LV716_05530 [Flagellimonas sp. HMM57]|uniref:hypothetical protein n=1 Tax=unclassified Flagellimonas TaxID=2644544 RepID=UPI0013D1931E|nr:MULTISPECIES: hypothetical protein [unclassified Flagellimonas]UII77233.1 hypothetical protein LV716_05530 [Flagellimonas sp. HMM57]
MDNFEKYIKENRQAFETHKVDKDKLWQGIALELNTESEIEAIPLWKSSILRVVASVVLLMGLSVTAFLMLSTPSEKNMEGYVNEELFDIDMHYQGLVHQQVQLVKNHPKLTKSDKEEFLSFMDELDNEYEQLKLEMQNNLDNELVLEAIVNNYRKRIELMENLLEQINASKKEIDYEGYTL